MGAAFRNCSDVYTLSVRVDGGAWFPPPGLPTTSDGFGGTVGVLVIP